MNVKIFFIEATSKIIENFNVGILKSLACINPILIRNNPVLSEKRIDILLQILHETRNLSALSDNFVKQQFTSLINKVQSEYIDQFSTF